jgi:arylsulfatase A-like enzyme
MKTKNRREFLKSTLAGGLGASLLSCQRKTADGSTPPNIVYIMADDLGYSDLGCYGQETIRTPNADRLAAEGMRFNQAYAGCTVCAPSRSVLMTGLHMGHTSVRSNPGGVPILPEDVTVAEVLKTADYRTGMFGKWGLGDIGTTGEPRKQGFDEFFGYYHQVHAHYYYPQFLYKNEEQYPLPGNKNNQRGQYSHDVIADQTLEFIRQSKDQPFFCYVPFTIPHLELLVPEDSLAEYRGKFPDKPYVDHRRGHYASQEHSRAALAGMITRMDRDVGRIMALLKDLGLDDNTIVFFTSDNGAASPLWKDDFFNSTGGLRGHKQNFYEGGIRVPMIARWPGKIQAGAVSDHIWSFWDFLPTAAELAGAEAPEGRDGISVVPALLGPEAAGRPQQEHEFLYWEMPRYNWKAAEFAKEIPRQAVRMGDWKAVRPEPDGPLELYNLAEDIGETRNVATEKPEVTARIEEYLKTARTQPRPQTQPDHDWWEHS